MGGSGFGSALRISTFGESHGGGVGVIVDGMPPGLAISEEEIQLQLNRRRPGQSEFTTPRTEADRIHILSGIFAGYTTGKSIGMVLYNRDTRSNDYDNIKILTGQAMQTGAMTPNTDSATVAAAGRASGRETSACVAAAAICLYRHQT